MGRTLTLFLPVGMVSQHLNIPRQTLYYWEKKFPQLKPMRRAGGRRAYRPEDYNFIRGIQFLRNTGHSIRDVQSIVKENGVEYVQFVWCESD